MAEPEWHNCTGLPDCRWHECLGRGQYTNTRQPAASAARRALPMDRRLPQWHDWAQWYWRFHRTFSSPNCNGQSEQTDAGVGMVWSFLPQRFLDVAANAATTQCQQERILSRTLVVLGNGQRLSYSRWNGSRWVNLPASDAAANGNGTSAMNGNRMALSMAQRGGRGRDTNGIARN